MIKKSTSIKLLLIILALVIILPIALIGNNMFAGFLMLLIVLFIQYGNKFKKLWLILALFFAIPFVLVAGWIGYVAIDNNTTWFWTKRDWEFHNRTIKPESVEANNHFCNKIGEVDKLGKKSIGMKDLANFEWDRGYYFSTFSGGIKKDFSSKCYDELITIFGNDDYKNMNVIVHQDTSWTSCNSCDGNSGYATRLFVFFDKKNNFNYFNLNCKNIDSSLYLNNENKSGCNDYRKFSKDDNTNVFIEKKKDVTFKNYINIKFEE